MCQALQGEVWCFYLLSLGIWTRFAASRLLIMLILIVAPCKHLAQVKWMLHFVINFLNLFGFMGLQKTEICVGVLDGVEECVVFQTSSGIGKCLNIQLFQCKHFYFAFYAHVCYTGGQLFPKWFSQTLIENSFLPQKKTTKMKKTSSFEDTDTDQESTSSASRAPLHHSKYATHVVDTLLLYSLLYRQLRVSYIPIDLI